MVSRGYISGSLIAVDELVGRLSTWCSEWCQHVGAVGHRTHDVRAGERMSVTTTSVGFDPSRTRGFSRARSIPVRGQSGPRGWAGLGRSVRWPAARLETHSHIDVSQ